MNPAQVGNDVAMFCHQVQLGFLARLSHLNGVQISIYLLLDRICGPNHEWITIGTRHICEALNLDRSNALIAIRGLIAAGLVESPEPGMKRRRWYRTRPNLPINQDDWTFRLFGEATRQSGRENPPDEAYANWSGKPTRFKKSGGETLPDQKMQSGGKTPPVVIQMNDFFEPLNKESIISLQERVSSSSEVVPESLKADEEDPASSIAEIEPAPPSYQDFRNVYPPTRLDDARALLAYGALTPDQRRHCLQGLIKHIECPRWRQSLATDAGRFIPLASNFITRHEYASEPPPYIAPKNGSAADYKSQELADRARKIFERTRTR